MIGQAAEFDYAGCQALKVLREDGFRTIVINSNPATIMTDPGFADRTYIEPLDLEGVTSVLRRERPDALLPTMGGQTALNLARQLHQEGVLAELEIELIGADVDAIARAEDRDLFRQTMTKAGLRVPKSVIATTYFNKIAVERGLRARALYRGVNPQAELSVSALKGLRDDGLAVPDQKPSPITQADVDTATVMFAIGCTLPSNATGSGKADT